MNLENILESFEEKQSDKLVNEINYINDFDDLESLEKKYQNIKHPYIGYLFGQKWLSFGNKFIDEAFPHYLNSASFGFDPNNIWLQTGYSNSIALSMYQLLKNYKYNNNDDAIFEKLAGNSYIILHRLIQNMGIKAYDSLKFKGFLLSMKNAGVKKLLKNYYYDGDDICVEILTISDYVLASVGYEKAGEINNRQEMQIKTKDAHSKILSLPQYSNMKNLDMAQIAELSNENQKYMFKKMFKDYKNDKFKLEEEQFKSKMNELKLEENSSFFGF